MTLIRDRSRVFVLESVVGWSWEPMVPRHPRGPDNPDILVVSMQGSFRVGFQRPDADRIEALLVAHFGPVFDPLTELGPEKTE